MADLMEIARRTRDRQRKESKQSKESSPPPEAPDPFACFPCFPFGSVPWNQDRASRMMYAADALVEHLGVNGNDPEVQSAAAMVHSAVQTRDMETVLYALAEFEAVVRRVALPGGKLSKLA